MSNTMIVKRLMLLMLLKLWLKYIFGPNFRQVFSNKS